MNRFLIALISTLAFFSSAYAQKQLSIERKADQVYPCENRKEMMAIFKCSKDLNLTFSSNYHAGQNVDILSQTIDTIGTVCEYRLVFPTEIKGAMKLNKRKLTIYCEGFDPVVLSEFNSDPKTCRIYEVKDPYLKLQTPYYKALNQATAQFEAGNYTDALAQYKIAMETPEYKENETNKQLIDERLVLIDSIIVWREKADQAYKNIKYMEALTYYSKILSNNPNDSYVIEKNRTCSIDHGADCNAYYKAAEQMYEAENLKEAKSFYQKIVDSDCSFKGTAAEKIVMIDKILDERKNKNNFFSYEWNENVPISFSVGTAKMRKWGGFFSLRTNEDLFELIRMEPSLKLQPEANISFGWTKKIIAPVWIHFGPGYTGKAFYTLKDSGISKQEKGEKLENSDYKFNVYSAISPEAGVMIKIWHINLRYTFQYRFALKSEYEDVIGKNRHYIAVGIAW